MGWQREARDRPAGLRTHVLVCLGSAIYTLASMGFGRGRDPPASPPRWRRGMGFLGAGTIIRHGSERAGPDHRGQPVGGGGDRHLRRHGRAKPAGWRCWEPALVLLTLTVLRRVERRFVTRTQLRAVTLRISGRRRTGCRKCSSAWRRRTSTSSPCTSSSRPSGKVQEMQFGVRLPAGDGPAGLMCRPRRAWADSTPTMRLSSVTPARTGSAGALPPTVRRPSRGSRGEGALARVGASPGGRVACQAPTNLIYFR